MSKLTVSNLKGGLSLLDPTVIKDNQFENLANFFYNSSQRVQTRRGYTLFGQPIANAVTLLNAADAVAGWAVSDDAAALATGTAIRGTFALTFNITVAASGTDQATLTHTTLGANITSTKGYIGFWLNVPTGFNTNLTAVKVRLGSDSSNYYEWTLPTLTMNANRYIVLTFATATTTGTPVDATTNYFRLQATYTATYTNQTGIKIDSLYAYSSTSTKPVTSYFFFQRDDTLVTTALCTAFTNMYKYDETSEYWEVIATGLTEYDTLYPSNKTRWSFFVYKNVIYMCNGVDNYRSFNGVTFTEYAGQPKYRYLAMIADRPYGAGDDTNPSTIYYPAAAPADASIINTNAVVVGGDEQGRINGIFAVGQVILAGKDKKIFYVDVTNVKAYPIDPQNGWFAQRSIQDVGNGILYFNDLGVANLQQRNALSGGAGLATTPLTDDLQPLIEDVIPLQYNAACGYYIDPIKNYYFSFDTSADNIPDTTIVRSSLNGSWSTYTIPTGYEYGKYIETDGTVHYVLASATTGQVYEIEFGFSDNGTAINADLLTKQYDFGTPTTWKDFEYITIYGLISTGGTIYVELLIDGDVVEDATITDSYADVTATTFPIGTSVIGTGTIGGGGSPTIDTFAYKAKIPLLGAGGGQKIQVHMYSNMPEIAWTLDKIECVYNGYSEDIFPISNIA